MCSLKTDQHGLFFFFYLYLWFTHIITIFKGGKYIVYTIWFRKKNTYNIK